jgi:hypothetical protein
LLSYAEIFFTLFEVSFHMLEFFKTFFRFDRTVTYTEYQRLVGAENYGAASSMGGLHTALRELLGQLGSGRNISVDRGTRGPLVIGSRHKFFEWVKSDFPGAYEAYFK